MNFRRIWRLLRKELLQTMRDKRMLAILFIAPVLQLFLFGYAVRTDINSITTAIYDEDRTAASRELTDRMLSSGYFEYRRDLRSPREIDRVIDTGEAQLVLRIPRGFAEDLASNRSASLQAIIDGSDSMSAGVINGYVSAVTQKYSQHIMMARLDRVRSEVPRIPGLEGKLRVWYNPELKSVNFMVPGVLCMILLIATMMLTSLGIVREKEIGTLEQLIVTPITPSELMLGKVLPFLLIGLLEMIIVLAVAISWFHVKVAGSLLLLFVCSAPFLMTNLGLGIFISTISKTQQEAMLTSVFFILPFILLSGFMFPIENMPRVIQLVTYLIPMRYFLEIIRGIFLKGVGLEVLWPQLLILTLIAICVIKISAMRFSKRLG